MWDGALNLLSGNLSGTPAAGSAKFLGKNRSYRVWGRCGGDVTGAGATCTVTIEESANGTTGWTLIAGPMTITEQVGYVGGTTPRPEVPSGVAVLPWLVFTTSKDYVRAVPALAGTTPVFPSVSVNTEPLDAAVLGSGR